MHRNDIRLAYIHFPNPAELFFSLFFHLFRHITFPSEEFDHPNDADDWEQRQVQIQSSSMYNIWNSTLRNGLNSGVSLEENTSGMGLKRRVRLCLPFSSWWSAQFVSSWQGSPSPGPNQKLWQDWWKRYDKLAKWCTEAFEIETHLHPSTFPRKIRDKDTSKGM